MPWRHRFWREFYDVVAVVYDAVVRIGARLGISNETKIRMQVVAAFSPRNGQRVLEVGCGTAENRVHLARSISYIGVDISRGMLARAYAKLTQLGFASSFVQADMVALPFPRESFPAILAMGALQHAALPKKAFKEIRRVSKPNADLMIIDERSAKARLLAAINYCGPTEAFGEYFVLQESH